MADSVKNHYPQVFLDECKYFVIEKNIPEFITDNIKIFADDSNREDSDEESSNGEKFWSRIFYWRKLSMIIYL